MLYHHLNGHDLQLLNVHTAVDCLWGIHINAMKMAADELAHRQVRFPFTNYSLY